MEILKIVERLEDYSRKIFAVMADEEFTETMSEAASLLIRQGEKIADLESKVAELEAQNRWIPVTERVPEHTENVLVLCTDKFANVRLEQAYLLAQYNPEDGWILEMWPEKESPNVTHWMPLPVPPKEVTR